MSSNIHGNDNEKDLQKALDEKYINELNENLKSFINFIEKKENIKFNYNTKIKAEKIGGCYKSDINIYIDNYKYGISIKTGKGNSVHQEKSSVFVDFLKNELNASTDICEDFKWFIDSEDDARTLKNKNPDKIESLKNFINKHKVILSSRFLKTGLNDENFVDYIYYGTPDKGNWGRIDDILNLIEKTESSGRATLKIGFLSLQAWNRTNEEKRYTLQVKWPSIQNDLNLLKHKE